MTSHCFDFPEALWWTHERVKLRPFRNTLASLSSIHSRNLHTKTISALLAEHLPSVSVERLHFMSGRTWHHYILRREKNRLTHLVDCLACNTKRSYLVLLVLAAFEKSHEILHLAAASTVTRSGYIHMSSPFAINCLYALHGRYHLLHVRIKILCNHEPARLSYFRCKYSLI